MARRPKLFRPGLYANILPGEESDANNASRARSQSQQKGYEISGLGPAVADQMEEDRGGEADGIDAIHDAAVAFDQRAVILHPAVPFDG